MLGKVLLVASALGSSAGSFIADFNETHVYNPRWPPHARFHNGQTMSMGSLLGLANLYYTFRPTSSPAAAVDSLFTAAIFGSVYWITGLSAIFYPGAKALDPEFGEGFPQFWLFVGLGTASWLGFFWETWGLKGGKGKLA